MLKVPELEQFKDEILDIQKRFDEYVSQKGK